MRMKIAHPMLWGVIKKHGVRIDAGKHFDLYFMTMQLFLVPADRFFSEHRVGG